ncbi:MAG: hypothetical protein IIA87_01170 [Nanoarchaeota archaeon]|nr:hypothetical protein [Nanoarchaeota archaeon]
MKQKTYLYIGIIILLILLISAFIEIPVESGPNYNTIAPLLGILIFYNPIILIIYIGIAIFLIWKGIGKRIKFV